MADTLRNRQAQLLRMGDALQAAARGADWDSLGHQVRALGPQLQALARLGPWSAPERAALTRLRRQHDDAAVAASDAARALGTRLEGIRSNQEGWVAYAMHSETESGASRP
ncbi:hypothetical protein [Massilia sp. 9096]|uniref:hypothetical protein n=1 Tax=Massilia sp. 9096 TaxID=1500894 RepID=UPI000AB46F82|nr:hypothetical protein [Massilia sp. 9096]